MLNNSYYCGIIKSIDVGGENMSIVAKDYVVLDVETNGLSSLNDDLLSISIYQPDTQKIYNRFFPLELDRNVYTTHINGITKKDLAKAKPLSQEELDTLIIEFDLCNRTILTYGSLDERFIRNYFKRKNLRGFEKLRFFNFKRNIISSRFSEGNITKDNLCVLYGIDNVQEQHNGINDCLLEWKLFEKLNGNKLLITHNRVFELNDSYIVPVSYLSTYPNFKYHTYNLPRFKCSTKVVKKLEIVSNSIKKFPTNFNGMTIEHLINVMLDVEKMDSKQFLLENKMKLKYIGTLPSRYIEVPMSFNSDGTVYNVNEKDKALAEELNSFLLAIKKELVPLIDYIKNNLFKNQQILSQELVVHEDKNVLAVCDLSSKTAVLEIKTYKLDVDKSADQLFYESNGRDCYILQIDWHPKKKKMCFYISKVAFELDADIQKKLLKKELIISNIEYLIKKSLSLNI